MRRVVIVFLVFSMCSLIFYFLLLETLPILMNMIMISKNNLTLFSDTSKTIVVQKLIVFDLMYLFPFLVSLASSFLLFLSLVKHSRSLNLISISSDDYRTKVHKKAVKMLLSFLILFIIQFFFHAGGTLVIFFFYFPSNRSIKFVLLTLITFPLSHSFILILGNSKLQQTAVRDLQHLKSQLQEMILSLHRFSKVFTKWIT